MVHAGIVFTVPEVLSMSTSSTHSEPTSVPAAGHDATRGVVNAAIVGAVLWSAMIAVLNWAIG
jgi:hypothetical protein